MKVTTETLEDSQVALNIEAEAGELNKAMDEAYHRLVNKVSVPGFRKGKAPRFILEQHIGKGSLLEEALEQLIPQLYREAVDLQKIEPIDQPQVEIIQTEPVVFKAVVPVKPTVELGDYRNLKLQPEPVEIADKEIDAAVELKRQEQAILTPVDRPVQFGDVVTMNIEANIEEKPFLNHKDIVYEVNKDSQVPLPGFAEKLKGAKKGKGKDFTLIMPLDHRVKEFAGKECFFKVTVTEVKEKQLPELDDKFSQTCGYDNLTAMKEALYVDLKDKAKQLGEQRLSETAVDAVVEISQVHYPPILENKEIDRILEREAHRLGFAKLNDYLNATNLTEEKMRDSLRPTVKKQIARLIVLDEIARIEKIEISESEVDNQINEMVKSEEGEGEKIRQFLQLPHMKESMRESLRRNKTADWLVKIATSGNQIGAEAEQ
jgi:trigger factor